MFHLDHSDTHCGSLIRFEDACKLFQVTENSLAGLHWENLEGERVINERELCSAWHRGEISETAPVGKSSFDELILFSLVKRVFPESRVFRQVRVGVYHVDLRVQRGDRSLFIEYEGPGHFTPTTLCDLREKKKVVEERTGITVVNWPYWIQRCETNVRALFNPSVTGYAALWNTKTLFGDFEFDDSSAIIDEFTQPFNAVGTDGYGYIYGPHTRGRNNPEHPIVRQILEGQASKSRIIPKGAAGDEGRWLPPALIE